MGTPDGIAVTATRTPRTRGYWLVLAAPPGWPCHQVRAIVGAPNADVAASLLGVARSKLYTYGGELDDGLDRQVATGRPGVVQVSPLDAYPARWVAVTVVEGVVCPSDPDTPVVAPAPPRRRPTTPRRRPTTQPPAPVRVSKEDAPCCVSRRDDLGRLPIGYCSPGCVRRPG